MTPFWWLTKDGDLDCLALYERHYSCYRYADGRTRKQFVGPGEKVVLRTKEADALFVWRNFIDDRANKGSTAPYSATSQSTRVPHSYAKRIKLLIASGLIAGITPTSERKRSAQATLDFAFSRQDGSDAE